MGVEPPSSPRPLTSPGDQLQLLLARLQLLSLLSDDLVPLHQHLPLPRLLLPQLRLQLRLLPAGRAQQVPQLVHRPQHLGGLGLGLLRALCGAGTRVG